MRLSDLSRRSLLARLGGLALAPRALLGAAHAQDHALDAEWLATAGVEGGFAPVVLAPDYAATPGRARHAAPALGGAGAGWAQRHCRRPPAGHHRDPVRPASRAR